MSLGNSRARNARQRKYRIAKRRAAREFLREQKAGAGAGAEKAEKS